MLNADEQNLIAEVCDVGADAVHRGLTLASGGNLSVRLAPERFAVSGAGTWLDKLTPEQFVIMDLSGEIIDIQRAARPSSEWKMHQRAYQTRADANCAIHLHPQYAVLLSSIGIDIRLITLDHAYYVKSIGVTEFYPNGSDELADTAAVQLKDHNCVILKHHGSVTVAAAVEMAYRRALNLEEAARATFIARQLGDSETVFPPEQFEALHHQ